MKKLRGGKTKKLGALQGTAMAPAIKLTSWKNSETLKAEDFNGQVTFLAFVTPGCKHCKDIIKPFNEYSEKHKGKIRFITAVDTKKGSEVKNYIKRHNIKNPTAKASKSLIKSYKIVKYPSVFIINKDGSLVLADFNRNYLPHVVPILLNQDPTK